MVARISNPLPLDANAQAFGATPEPGLVWLPGERLGASQPLLAMVQQQGRRVLRALSWGLVPFWASDRAMAHECLVARAEVVAERPAFRHAYKKNRRCAVLTTGWIDDARGSAHRVHAVDGRILALAGLWETWRHPITGEAHHSVALATCPANAVAARASDRMPVVLDGDALTRWLAPDSEHASLRLLLRPCDATLLVAHPADALDPTAVTVERARLVGAA